MCSILSGGECNADFELRRKKLSPRVCEIADLRSKMDQLMPLMN